MKTFSEIEHLLRELKSVEKGQKIMLENGMVDRTSAGSMFFMTQIRRTHNIYQKLSEYPSEWVESVETIMDLRK